MAQQPPVEQVWIKSAPSPNAALARIRPDVHSVEIGEQEVTVRSAGISLAYLGPLELSPLPRADVREFVFKIPRSPTPETNRHAHVPLDYIGVFVNGVPIPNHFEAASYQGQNLWHYDLVARGDDGSLTATGAARAALTHAPSPGLLNKLATGHATNSPIIAFALDGYPIHGPWAEGKRIRSSYQLRKIATREHWPDGTLLAPGQTGPPVGPGYPLGTFVEDYEYVPGSGDLDQYNGKASAGTYAYFLTTDPRGKLEFPYLLAHEFHGRFTPTPAAGSVTNFQTGRPALLRFKAPARRLEHVHERPMHVMIISRDLASFAHIHPEVTPYGDWEVTHTFHRPGRYRIYSEFTPPGANQRVEFFDVQVTGPAQTQAFQPHQRVLLENAHSLRAGQDTELLFRLKEPVPQWQPYLGAWAHVAIAGESLSSFLHAHPMENSEGKIRSNEVHSHTPEALGPPPSLIRVAAVFTKSGRYKLWLQMQVDGHVETTPFEIQVGEALPTSVKLTQAPPGAIKIHITSNGYEPMSVPVPANRKVTLAFLRSGSPNCGAKVVFPELGLTKEIPLGGMALVEIPPSPSGELRFTCGMGMYRGRLVISR